MTRFVVTLLAFAAPFALFWLYTRLQARTQRAGAKDPWPMAVLWLTGAILAVETMALTAISAPAPGGVYVPARIEDGRVVPWHYEQAQPKPPLQPNKPALDPAP